MNITSETNSKSLTILTVLEVAKKVKLTDFDAAKKWLVNKNITIHKETKTHFVYELDVDCEIDKNWVRDLKIRFPNDWKSIYRKVAKDSSVYEMVVLALTGEMSTQPMTKIKKINNEDESLYNKLIAK